MSDYIERENAKHAVWGCTRDTGIDEAPFEYAEGLLENVPSADVAPVRHGHWVESFKVNAPPTLRSRWTCSWCGNVQTYGATDFCPNCGAKMDGGDDDEKRQV